MATSGLYGSSPTGALIAQSGAETPGLYGKSPNGSAVAGTGTETLGLYGNTVNFGGTYFEWFIFQEASTQPATPTGGTWNFTINSGTPPTGWTLSPPTNPTNEIWVSIAYVNSKTPTVFTWSIPGLFGVVASTTVGTTTTGAPGTNASVNNSGTAVNAVLNFTIPRGDTGATGATGTAATIAVGTTTTTNPGTSATVTNSGSSSAAVFNFGIPKGAGVNVGGTTGQVLTKASGTDYDTAWTTITGTLNYQGAWNALTNSPTLTSSVGTNGYYYVVTVAGTTNLNGITDWQIGDWAIFNGSIWQKIDQTNLVTSVAGRTGAVVLSNTDISGLGTLSTQNANAVAITGGTISGLSSPLPVASGGTGVTASTGANSVVLRDANANITTNQIFEGFLNVVAAGTTTVLTSASVPNYVVTGSGGQTYQLPDATTLPAGTNFTFNNNQSSGTIVVKNNSGTTVATVQSGSFLDVSLLNNSTAPGSWDNHNNPPANASWSTNTLDWAGSYTSGTWNGNVVAYNRGGTGQSAAFVAGGVVYGSTTSALAVTSVGTSGQVLTSSGTGAPTWTTPTTGTVTSVTGTAPINSSGGSTPAISLATAYGDTQNPYASKTANYVLAAPNGSTGVPTFRAIVAADIPTLNQNTTGTASNVTGTVAIANGGTGLTSYTAGDVPYFASGTALSKLGIGTANQVLTSSGTAPQWSSALTVTGLTDSGNLTFTGTGNRITGDFDNATFSNRVAFQTSTTNANTTVNAIPNGTATTSQFITHNAADPNNASRAGVNVNSTVAYFFSDQTGTGTYVPMAFRTSGTSKLTIAADTTGTYTFGGTAPRITGDFNNGTIASRLMFQGSVVNGETVVTAIPNGTSASCQLVAANASDPTNAQIAQVLVSASEASFRSAAYGTGTGTYLPMTFYTGGSERIRIDTSGNVGIGNSSPNEKLHVAGAGRFTSTATSLDQAGAFIDYSSGVARITGEASTGGTLAFYTNPNAAFVAERMRIDSSGNVLVTNPAGLGYGTGAGGTVTQATSKSTAVTLNKPTGQITMNNAALAANTVVSFAVINSLVAATDTIIVNTTAVAGSQYNVWTSDISAGYFYMQLRNITGASLSEAVKINFTVLKGATS